MRTETRMFKKLLKAVVTRVSSFFARNGYALAGAASLLLALTATAVLAGDGSATGVAAGVTGTGSIAGTAFDDTWATIAVWMSGTLGRSLAAVMILAGVAMGIARMSIMAVIPGIAAGFTMFLGPQILTAIVSATL